MVTKFFSLIYANKLALLLTFFCSLSFADRFKPITVIIPSYNNVQWYEKNLDSIIVQNYPNFKVLYIDDQSKDGTADAVETYFKSKNLNYQAVSFNSSGMTILEAKEQFCDLIRSLSAKYILVRNQNRVGALANLYRGIQSCNNWDIVVTVDGDDWITHREVLSNLNIAYTRANIWLTHGKLIEYPSKSTTWCIPVPDNIVKANAFRTYRCPSHLRTFYSWLFKKIKLEDLLYEGDFFKMTWDQAIMFPMIEMAGERHQYIREINYVYNMTNSINDNKVDPALQNNLEMFIRAMPSYQRLHQNEVPSY